MKKQIRTFEEDNIISFSNRRELIRFVSKYFATQYKNFLKAEYAEIADSEEAIIFWEDRIEVLVSGFERSLKKILILKKFSKKVFEINCESNIFKIIFKNIGERANPKYCFSKNVKYEIYGLTFKRTYC